MQREPWRSFLHVRGSFRGRPRQVGKTTMLQKLTGGMNYVSLDDYIVRIAAQEEGGTFFKDNPPPVFVDEIQKVPELFPQIKLLLDCHHKKGQFFLCGSQQFQMILVDDPPGEYAQALGES